MIAVYTLAPMPIAYSVVVCSIDPLKFQKIQSHYRELLGSESHELIAIHDARSLAEAYNRGITRATGEVIIISHDDVEFLSPATWLSRLQNHITRFDIVGIVGTNRMSFPHWELA